MYSEEIEKLLKIRQYMISVKEYFEICNSPQVDHVKYEKDDCGYDFNIWTKDGYYWKVRVLSK